jgi:hypothetical protein
MDSSNLGTSKLGARPRTLRRCSAFPFGIVGPGVSSGSSPSGVLTDSCLSVLTFSSPALESDDISHGESSDASSSSVPEFEVVDISESDSRACSSKGFRSLRTSVFTLHVSHRDELITYWDIRSST